MIRRSIDPPLKNTFNAVFNLISSQPNSQTPILYTTGRGIPFTAYAKRTRDKRRFISLPYNNRIYVNDWGCTTNHMGKDGQRIGQYEVPLDNWASAYIPSNIWARLKRMSGRKCYTLTYDREAVMRIKADKLIIEYPSGGILTIPRKMAEEAWSSLESHSVLTSSDMHAITGQDGDRTDRLLSVFRMLRGVTFNEQPRILYLNPKTKPPQIVMKKKYGSHGEGRHHKLLKEWCAQNPQFFSFDEHTKLGEIEYGFICGDSADIMFSLNDGRYAVVEIETNDTLPGAHQSLKYKTLLCSKKGLPVDSEKVIPILVAWNIPMETKAFCRSYSIKWYEKRI